MARQGEIIDGKYEILREIGRGGMSIVYLAMDKRLNKQWAIKEFRKDKDDDSRKIALEALLKEANLMKKLDHPTLPRIVDIIDLTGTVYIVMDYIEGESLNKVLDAYGAQPQDAVIEWAKQLSEVLDYLHTRVPPVIYRDMKPANIMLKPDGTIRLIDFGIAREYKEGKDGDTTSIGTRGYAAPEQFGDKGQTDARTDIYSFGVTLYHLVTGKNPAEPPYEIYPIRHWNPNLSSGLEWLIQKCTQLNPKDRFQSCAEVSYVLDNLEKFEGAYKKKQKKKIRLFVAALACTVVFALLGVGAMFLKGANHDERLNEIKQAGTITAYINAIEYDNTDVDSYQQFVKCVKNNTDVIYPGENTYPNPEDARADDKREVYEGELNKVFTDANMETFKAQSPDEYVMQNYDLGLTIWKSYSKDDADKSANKSGSLDAINAAFPYFERVVTQNCKGLSEEQKTTAEYYYLLGYFKKNELGLGVDDTGVFVFNDAAVYNIINEWGEEGIECTKEKDSYKLSNPYYAYWKLITRSTEHALTSGSALNENIRLTTVFINAHTVCSESKKLFKSGATDAEIKDFYDSAVRIYEENKTDDSVGEFNAKISEVRLKNLSEATKAQLNTLKDIISEYYEKNDKKITLAEIND